MNYFNCTVLTEDKMKVCEFSLVTAALDSMPDHPHAFVTPAKDDCGHPLMKDFTDGDKLGTQCLACSGRWFYVQN
jgi:hypothetical protein